MTDFIEVAVALKGWGRNMVSYSRFSGPQIAGITDDPFDGLPSRAASDATYLYGTVACYALEMPMGAATGALVGNMALKDTLKAGGNVLAGVFAHVVGTPMQAWQRRAYAARYAEIVALVDVVYRHVAGNRGVDQAFALFQGAVTVADCARFMEVLGYNRQYPVLAGAMRAQGRGVQSGPGPDSGRGTRTPLILT